MIKIIWNIYLFEISRQYLSNKQKLYIFFMKKYDLGLISILKSSNTVWKISKTLEQKYDKKWQIFGSLGF